MNWRNLALAMTGACGGLLLGTGHPAGGFLLLVIAVFLAALTHKWVKL